MTGRDWSIDPEGERVEVGDAVDVIEGGPREPSPRRGCRLVVLGVLLVLVSAAGGYLVGRRQSQSAAPRPRPPASPPLTAVNDIVVGTGHQCAVQVGDRLQLGVEVVNRAAAAVTLRQVQANLPLHGLRATATAWGTCGQLSPVPAGAGLALPAAATTWLTVTFDVLVPCPQPLPVLFELSYTQDGHDGVSNPRGFPDLGDVPYSKCSAS